VDGKDMNDIFGTNSRGRVSELSEINTDAWPLISAEPRRTETPKRNPEKRPPQSQPPKPQQSAKKAQPKKEAEKKKSGYVGAKTGLGKKKTSTPEGRISKGAADKKAEDKRKQNKKTASDNNIKRPPS